MKTGKHTVASSQYQFEKEAAEFCKAIKRLAENIHWEERYPDDAPEESPPIEPCAQILNDNPGEYSEMCWYFLNRAELFKWEAAADWNSNISGIINTYDD